MDVRDAAAKVLDHTTVADVAGLAPVSEMEIPVESKDIQVPVARPGSRRPANRLVRRRALA